MNSGAAPEPPLGHFVEVEGRKLFIDSCGDARPPVVLLPGAGAVGLDYWNVQQLAGGFTRSVIYDRAGTGWSDRVRLPRRSTEVTDEMYQLLQVTQVPAPYVLVGHSLGGLYARHFAQRFPGEVAGLVLLDPPHEDLRSQMPKELVEQWESWDPDQVLPDELPEELLEFYRSLFAREMATWPAEIREPLVEAHGTPAWLGVGIDEASNLAELYDEMRGAGPWSEVPTIFLCSMLADEFKRAASPGQSEALLQAEIESKKCFYDGLAASIPHGETRPVDAGHVTISLRRAEAVIEALHDVISE